MSGGEDHPFAAGHAADHRQAVRRHRAGAAPELAHRAVGRQADGAPPALSQVRHPPGAHAHVPAGQLQRAAQTQRVAQRRQDDVRVAQVQRQFGKVRRSLHVHAVALGRLDRQPQAEPARELRRPRTGREHHLRGLERAARREGAHAGARRLEGEHLRAGRHRRAGLLGQAGHGTREAHGVQVTVLGEEERPGELAAQAGEEPAGLRRRHLVDARAEGARPLDVLARGREAGRSLEHLQLAVVVEAPLLAAPGGELVVQARARHVQRAQHGRGRRARSLEQAARNSQSQRASAGLGRGAM